MDCQHLLPVPEGNNHWIAQQDNASEPPPACTGISALQEQLSQSYYRIHGKSKSSLTSRVTVSRGCQFGSRIHTYTHVSRHTVLESGGDVLAAPKSTSLVERGCRFSPSVGEDAAGHPVLPSSSAVAGKYRSDALVEDHLASDDDMKERYRDYQHLQWDQAFEELLKFRSAHGHCQVPHDFKENPSLSRWVKRQRYQNKLLKEGKPSTMSADRIERLDDIGFVWHSHDSNWDRRFSELCEFHRLHGHVSVPTAYKKNPQLATWVKQQRRQYKMFSHGRSSSINLERIEQLQSLGFEWSLRTRREKI